MINSFVSRCFEAQIVQLRPKEPLVLWKAHCAVPVALAGIGLLAPAPASIGATDCQLPTVQLQFLLFMAIRALGPLSDLQLLTPGHEVAVCR